jgi:FkbM family methyltransferase
MNYTNKVEWNEISTCLRKHEGVEAAIVRMEEITPEHKLLIAYVVPDRHQAGEVRRACELEADGSLKNLSLYEPAKDLLVAQKNRTETDFLYREIFLDDVYFRHGIELTENACVVDVGANIGMFAIFVAIKHPDARIISIEPVPELSQAVQANAKIHKANITVFNCALGSESGFTKFTYYPNNTVMSGRFADELEDRETLRAYLTTEADIENEMLLDELIADRMSGQLQECKVMTLNQIVEQEDIKQIDLLKIDVEKAEMEVLSAIDESTWAKIAQIVIEVHDLDGRVGKVEKMLRERQFIVSCEHDHRLSQTNCFNIYGYLERNGSKEQNIDSTSTHRQSRCPSRQSFLDDLKNTVQQILPNHRLPDLFVLLDTIPVTADGDIDFEQLEAIRTQQQGSVQFDLEPRTPTEKSLASIWREIFGKSDATLDLDFFESGGNSLTAVRLIARVEEIFGENALSPDTLFETSQLGELAAAIDSALNEK